MDFVFRFSIDFVDSLPQQHWKHKKKMKKKKENHATNIQWKVFGTKENVNGSLTFPAVMIVPKSQMSNSISFANLHGPMLAEVMVMVLVKLSYCSVNQSAETHLSDELT